MLTEPIITAFLPTTNQKQAKQFYEIVIGLNFLSEDDYALEFEGNGVSLRITTVENFIPHPFTVLGFKIKQIRKQVEFLKDKGVGFESYDGMEQDDLGIWVSPRGAKVAWFKDPDGNLISLTEY